MKTTTTTPESISYDALASEFREIVRGWEGQRIAVLGHVRPDGDCIGSQVALARVLRDHGIDAVCVNRDPIPRNLATFVGDTPFYRANDFDPSGYIGVSTDCADLRRIGDTLAGAFPEIAFNVDHHISNPGYATHNIIVDTASATAEILGSIYTTAGLPFDATTAQALYVGIATDTGQFRFNTTTPHTFELCRRLCEHGADPAAASFLLYEQESLGRIQLLQRFLASLRLEFGGRVCIGMIHDGDYRETATTSEDSEGLVDYARSIEGVEIGVFLEEQDGFIKGSFRSKQPRFRVDALARHVRGGGHACAAGFRIEDRIESFYPRLLDLLRNHFENLPDS